MNILFSVVLAVFGTISQITAGSDISLESKSGKVIVSLNGGRILSWKDSKGQELFFMPTKKWSPDGDWSHGGTSICWPWFGRKGTAQSLIHGFARNRKFTFRKRESIPGGESVTLGLKVSKNDSSYFPFDADLELTVSFSGSLSLKLKTTNFGKEPFEITEGFQSYFPVKDYGNVIFMGVESKDFALVDGMDKAFRRLGKDFGFREIGAGAEIRLGADGNTGLVVWTPGTVEPANRNLAKDDCPKFIVIGPSSRAAEGVISVKPGESHVLDYTLSYAQ